MTTYGFLATNGGSQVLISSKTKNLHFLGKATYYSTIESVNLVGGLRRWAYRIESQSIPVPFFSVPTADRYAITKMTNVTGNIWEIEIMRSGTSSTLPEVYVFSDINSAMKPTGNWGMQVFNETNGTTYDSRLRPLVIRGSSQVQPPNKPHNPALTSGTDTTGSFHTGGYDHGFCTLNTASGMERMTPNYTNDSTLYNTNCTKPIVNYQSIAQTHVQCDDFHSYIWHGFLDITQTHWGYYSHYWGFFRAAVSIQQSGAHSYINCGWVNLKTGCFGDNPHNDTFAGIGFAYDKSVGGTSPISNQTLNLRDSTLIITDGALYD